MCTVRAVLRAHVECSAARCDAVCFVLMSARLQVCCAECMFYARRLMGVLCGVRWSGAATVQRCQLIAQLLLLAGVCAEWSVQQQQAECAVCAVWQECAGSVSRTGC